MYLNNLNEAQIKAVNTIDGPILCLAGAGSGKTTTLTYRVANLINNGVNPSNILLLTFTKKAANDMIARVNSLVGNQGKYVESGTFHRFASQIISKYGNIINIKNNFTVIDDNDSADIIQSIRDSNLDCLENFQNRINKNFIFQIFSKARNFSKSIKDTLNEYYSNYNINDISLDYLNKKYTTYKEENNLLDYDDLIDYLYRILLIPDIQQQLSEQCKYIMVDEYQDTNITQALITHLLAEKHQNIMVVGDDAQSIYSFRGSRIENIINFKKLFPKCKVIKLEVNYRSFGNILKGCNSLIDNSVKCIKKKLITDKPDGNKIILVKCLSEKEEASLIAHRVLQFYNMGYSLNDMAVLFRNSSYSYELELELAKRGIPYKKSGGPRIFDSEHIRNVISYLRILNNPYDRVSWLKVLNLIKGIGIQSATNIYDYILNNSEPFNLNDYKIRSELKQKLLKLSNMLMNCTKYINKKPDIIINFIIDYYISLLKNENTNDLNKIIKDLDQVSIITSQYSSLQQLLSEIYIEKNEKESTDINNNSSQMSLTLSTIHSAKGLEWKNVFILSALECRLPSKFKNVDELEEERRLMYVVMTRAKENLMISYPVGIWDKISKEYLSYPSRFINDISPDSIEIWQIKH